MSREDDSVMVYVALGCVDYEGDVVFGIYPTPDEAIERCQTIYANTEGGVEVFTYHSYEVAAWEIGHDKPDRSQGWSWRPNGN